MTATIAATVILVSRHRPAALRRCITAIRQSDHRRLELVVVADPAAIQGLRADGLCEDAKLVVCDIANIAVARNLGLAAAAGQVVAFIDDDAVPEPTWLSRLIAPFVNSDVQASGGFVRGRNGLSYQWRGHRVDTTGQDHLLAVDPDQPSLHPATPGVAVKTQGTNCAFRRDTVLGMGGFDPGFRFYLDEADLNMRLAVRGALTAIVPLAEVHHGFAESRLRRPDRVPRSLHEVGASAAVFLRRHAAPIACDPALDTLRRQQRARLLAHMVAGRIEPRDVGRLMATLAAGITEGLSRQLAPLAPMAATAGAFLPLCGPGPRPNLLLAGRFWQSRRLRKSAIRAINGQNLVTVLQFSPTALFHKVRFMPEGYWLQTGGLFGKSDRSGRYFTLMSFNRRVAKEESRIRRTRPA